MTTIPTPSSICYVLSTALDYTLDQDTSDTRRSGLVHDVLMFFVAGKYLVRLLQDLAASRSEDCVADD
ncbi:hypothetical protein BAUCODRAFT_124506 [Baudoinia panamericana UAMH 10762]|uniref:Uncharacterized protein n=1 Tax=Baudoinia panamericana (strain UAMH 10762) TaxID=717646 RepID=M2N3Z7_BAUPA|nr:uncharacterized protein BAUCODRAFT_124506 [Baudoinia panamericana UAMH 10762]EMC93744.1 hypothetical protein BAUCODRAFT_124506 [Baudoinia panamericana UAMH 10762]